MSKTDQLTVARARELFSVVGSDLVWKCRSSSSSRIKIGSIAGTAHKDGYVSVWADGVSYLAHRIVWLIVHGQWPEESIDHINGDGSDNSPENLRDVSHGKNMQNQRTAHSNKMRGLLGTHWKKDSCKWTATIRVDKKTHFLGYFETTEDAHAAYLTAKREMHSTCTI